MSSRAVGVPPRHEDVGRDLSGYEDGTENPKRDAASAAAFVTEGPPGLAGDGIVDALFRFTRPTGTSYFFCPPVRDGVLDLRALLAR